MSDLRELYQEVILDHTRRPRNFRAVADANHAADGHNRLCGDKLRVYMQLEGNRIKDIAFQGNGCAISTASASMMTEALKGKTAEEANALFEQFHTLVTGAGEPADQQTDLLGKLVVFAGVREFPVRVKCATLAWHTMVAAMKEKPQAAPVSTE